MKKINSLPQSFYLRYTDKNNIITEGIYRFKFLNLSKLRKMFDQKNLKRLKEILHNPADI